LGKRDQSGRRFEGSQMRTPENHGTKNTWALGKVENKNGKEV